MAATRPVDEVVAELREAIEHLASFPRPSASDGERRAADWIAARLRREGCDAHVEEERAHGGYWWPLGLLSAAAGVAALWGRRDAAVAVGAAAAAGIADDITGGAQWFRRRMLPGRSTWNVVAQAGDRDADRTLVLVAHHDAAHTSVLFHPAPSRWVGTRFPGLLERTDTTPPLMWPVVGGPLLTALAGLTGARALRAAAAVLSLGTAAAMAEIGLRPVVPGANDNLTGVAVLIGVARLLRDRPAPGLRVVLLSTGSEESFMEGMQAFARRHFGSLPPDRTHVVCLDTVGSPRLVLLEGEGMLAMREYPADFKDLVAACAAHAGVALRRGLRFRNATDGLIALRAGYPTAMLGSVNAFKVPDNYHWATDVPANVDLGTVADTVTVCDVLARRLASAR